MKSKKILFWLLSLLFIAVGAFSSAYFISTKLSPKPPTAEDAPLHAKEIINRFEPVVSELPTLPPTPEPTPVMIYYSLVLENRMLVLYEIDGEAKKEIKKLTFEPALFPEEDIRLLKSGIRAKSLEEGIEILENFIS